MSPRDPERRGPAMSRRRFQQLADHVYGDLCRGNNRHTECPAETEQLAYSIVATLWAISK